MVFATLGIVGTAAVVVAVVWGSVPVEAMKEPLPALQKLPLAHYSMPEQHPRTPL